MKQLIAIFTVFTAVACNGDWSTPVLDEATTPANVTIADMQAYFADSEIVIADNIMFVGRVVSSTRAGNFYNTFFIDDGTGAVEIMAGWPDLDAVFHPGQRIAVKARGLAVGWRDGIMQLGLPPDAGSRYPTGYFYHPTIIAGWVAAERSVIPVAPVDTSIPALRRELCGRLVRLSGLAAEFSEEASSSSLSPYKPAATWATRESTGYIKMRGVATDSITVITSNYASFAAAPVPRGRGSLTGILLYGKGGTSKDHYLLKLRYEEDIDF